ncbi:hypothetical protein [Lacisediminimonas profundi]|uniref:hypothetical protein n=1 Tax=Lacisediminimonas profundi TaxID=2603856 RepID=UPI00124B087A|nr:hypothetical protein [Lacisediminimonas profundi]
MKDDTKNAALNNDLANALSAAQASEQMDPGAAGAPGMPQLGVDPAKAANIEGWKIAVMQAVPMIESFLPEFKARVTRDMWEAFGVALGEACDYYGLGLGEALNHPLVKLAMAAFPIGLAAIEIKKSRIQAAIEANRPPAPPAAISTPASAMAARSGHPAVTVRNMDETQKAS